MASVAYLPAAFVPAPDRTEPPALPDFSRRNRVIMTAKVAFHDDLAWLFRRMNPIIADVHFRESRRLWNNRRLSGKEGLDASRRLIRRHCAFRLRWYRKTFPFARRPNLSAYVEWARGLDDLQPSGASA